MSWFFGQIILASLSISCPTDTPPSPLLPSQLFSDVSQMKHSLAECLLSAGAREGHRYCIVCHPPSPLTTISYFSDNQIYRKRSAFFSARFCPSLLQVLSDNFNFYILFSKQIKLFWTVMMLCLFSSFYITLYLSSSFYQDKHFNFQCNPTFLSPNMAGTGGDITMFRPISYLGRKTKF